MTRGGLAPFFSAHAVAVIGASSDASKVGGSVLANLRAGGFAGTIVPVNATRPVVQGLPAVPSILDVEGSIDLAVLAVPAPAVLATLKQCVAEGVQGAVVISAGFRESGGEGAEREAELRHWLREQLLRVMGPNCLGWIRPSLRLNTTFAPGMPRAGAIGFVSHSGALCTAILDWSREHHLGFSVFASLGNQADVTEADLLDALADDAETRVILAYLEGVADGRAFYAALRPGGGAQALCTPQDRPLRRGGACRRLAHWRTCRLRSRLRCCGEAGGRRARHDPRGPLRRRARRRRGPRADEPPSRPRHQRRRAPILATDAARDAGLDVAALDVAVRARAAAVLPANASLANPVDIIADATPSRYAATLEALAGQDASYVVMLAPQAATDAAGVARSILGTTRHWTAPVLAVFAGGARVRPGEHALEEGGVPCYPFPERAVGTLAHLVTLAERRDRPAPAPPTGVDRARVAAALALLRPGERFGFVDGAPLLEACGIPTVAATVAKTADDAAPAAGGVGFPVALKIVSRDIVHKTDVGGVVLGLESPAAVRRATSEMLARVRAARPDSRVDGILVQQMATGVAWREMLLGMVRDRQFGPLVVLGFGGIWVELLRDTATRLAPLDHVDADLMIDELRLGPALGPARGMKPVDREALVAAVCRFAQLAADLPDIAELEINPLLVGPRGVVAVDVRGTLTPLEGS